MILLRLLRNCKQKVLDDGLFILFSMSYQFFLI